MIYASTAWKLSKYGVFLVRIFLYSDQKKFRIWKRFTQWREELAYSLVPNCRGGVKLLTLGKSPQVYLIIMREWPKNNPLVLRNLDNCSLVHFIRPPTIRHKGVTTEESSFERKHKGYNHTEVENRLKNKHISSMYPSWQNSLGIS